MKGPSALPLPINPRLIKSPALPFLEQFLTKSRLKEASSEKIMWFFRPHYLQSGLLVTGIEAPPTGRRVKNTGRHCFPIKQYRNVKWKENQAQSDGEQRVGQDLLQPTQQETASLQELRKSPSCLPVGVFIMIYVAISFTFFPWVWGPLIVSQLLVAFCYCQMRLSQRAMAWKVSSAGVGHIACSCKAGEDAMLGCCPCADSGLCSF